MKKIMFNDKYGLTKAVLEGRKTMTRRIVNFDRVHTLIPGRIAKCCLKYAPYKVGQVVALAQSLRDMGYDPRDTRRKSGAIWGLDHTPAWTNKMFVSASDCIHQIRITNIRVERLRDISDEECLREGVFLDETAPSCYQPFYTFPGSIYHDTPVGYKTPREAFAALIDEVLGKGTWKSNPWVFVYEFELVK